MTVAQWAVLALLAAVIWAVPRVDPHPKAAGADISLDSRALFPDKFIHFALWYALALTLTRVFPVMAATGIAVAFAPLYEWRQWARGDGVFDPLDMLAGMVGALVGGAVMHGGVPP